MRKEKLGTHAWVAGVLALALTGSAQGAVELKLYGIIDSGLVYRNTSRSGVDEQASDADQFEQRSGVFRGSRWGIRGAEELGEGYRVSFVLENGFETDTGSTTLSRFFGREAQVSLSGPFGDIGFGRLGMLMSGCGTYTLANWFSPFGTTWGNFSAAGNNYQVGHQRLDNAVVYRTPSFSGLRLSLQYSFDLDSLQDQNADLPGRQHATEGKSEVDRYYAVGLSYKNQAWDLAFVVDAYDYGLLHAAAAVDDAHTVSLGGSYRFKKLKLYGGVQYFDNASTTYMRSYNQIWSRKSYEDGLSLIAGVEIPAGKGNVFAAAGGVVSRSSLRQDDSEVSRLGASLGYNYYLSKKSVVYTMINYARDRRDVDYVSFGRRVQGTDRADTVEIGLGLTHWF